MYISLWLFLYLVVALHFLIVVSRFFIDVVHVFVFFYAPLWSFVVVRLTVYFKLWPLAPLVPQQDCLVLYSQLYLCLRQNDMKIIFPATTTSSFHFLKSALHVCPSPVLKTNNLLLLMTPPQYISTFLASGTLCSLELVFLGSPFCTRSPFSYAHILIQAFVFLLLCCLLITRMVCRDIDTEKELVI